jgi:signal peptidase I
LKGCEQVTIRKVFRVLFNLARQIALIVVITLAISILVIQTYDINDVSMEPTFDSFGNRVVVFLTPYLFGATPDRGDIVIIDSRLERERSFLDRVIESPLPALFIKSDREHMWVKRVVALPGDTIESKQGHLYLNGKLYTEDYIKEKMETEFEPVAIPDGHIYVMGDNRNRSSDSRKVGPVPLSNIQGRVLVRIFPFSMVDTY